MSMSRRGFLRSLAFAVPAAFVLPEVVKTIFLPPPPDYRHSLADYLARYEHGYVLTGDFHYKMVERYSEGFTDWQGVFGSSSFSNALPVRAADLSEASLEEMLRHMAVIPNPVVRPIRRIVSPAEYREMFPEDIADQALRRLQAELAALRPKLPRVNPSPYLTSKDAWFLKR